MKVLYITILTWLLTLSASYATDKRELMRRFSEANRQLNMVYDYRLWLWNKTLKKNVDSSSGHLSLYAGQYIDSTATSITARIGKYFCKLDHNDKTAVVVDMEALGKSVGIRVENDEQKILFQLSDSVIRKYNGNYVVDTSHRDFYRLKAQLKDHPVSYVQVDFRKDNFRILSAYIELEEQEGGDAPVYLTRLFLHQVRPLSDPGLFDTSRFFSIRGSKVILSKKYATYKLI